MGKNVIVACDFNSEKDLINFLDKMENIDSPLYCKVGMELFNTGALQCFNPIKIIKNRGSKVFLDLKLKDIPNTVVKTVKVLVDSGVDMINVHADGGFKMMQEVVNSVNEIYEEYAKEYEKLEHNYSYTGKALKDSLERVIANKPLLLGVTVLTSMGKTDLEELNINNTPMEQVVSLAKMCKQAGFDGVVCSPEEVIAVKEACGENFITVTPGIRFENNKKDDQTRIATPATANIMGSDYIVVGRPITESIDPVQSYNICKKDFTEEVKDLEKLESAKNFITNIKRKIVDPANETAKHLIEVGAFRVNTEDPFILKSGIASPLYCNCRDLYKYPLEQKLIMDYLASLIEKYYPDCEVIFGTPMSAIPFGALVAERLGLPFGFVRDNKKDHGLNTKVEGPIEKGKKIVQVEDLLSSGSSALQSIKVLQQLGANVLGVAGIVDNNFIETISLKEENIEYNTITTMEQIVKYALEQGLIEKEVYESVIKYGINPLDESWMNEKAKNNVYRKRLLKKD